MSSAMHVIDVAVVVVVVVAVGDGDGDGGAFVLSFFCVACFLDQCDI